MTSFNDLKIQLHSRWWDMPCFTWTWLMIYVIPEINANADTSIFNSMPLLCPFSMVSDMSKSIIHGAGKEAYFSSIVSKHFKGCILVFEYCYFLLQNDRSARSAFKIALKEYQQSDTQAIVSNALQDAIKKHSNDHDTLINDITDIIITNQMCKLFNVLVQASEPLMIHISKKTFVKTLQYAGLWYTCYHIVLSPDLELVHDSYYPTNALVQLQNLQVF